MESEFLNELINKAKENRKKIVLPEATDLRILKAAEYISNNGFADIILIGNEEEVTNISKNNQIDISKLKIIDPLKFENLDRYANEIYELRKNKGMTLQIAKETIKNNMYFATMMVKLSDADGLVSGAIHSTSDTLRPALQIIKAKEGINTVSSFFLLETNEKELGSNGVFVFSDCGLVEFPNEEQLMDIASSSAKSFKDLVGVKPKVALLSYSTKGSAKGEAIDKIVRVKDRLLASNVCFDVDGELQLDSAIIAEVAKLKAPGSMVAGQANVLVFPDLQSGNIGYKLVQRFGHALAIGPITQGLKKPVNDLSRGCNVKDIIGAVTVTCIQACD